MLLVVLGVQPVHGKDAIVYMDVPPGSTGMTLKEAFMDPAVTRILVQESLIIRQDEWLPRGQDLLSINRSIVITAVNSKYVIDFNFTQESVELLDGVVMTFKDICVNNTR
jgi:hypothetical protein